MKKGGRRSGHPLPHLYSISRFRGLASRLEIQVTQQRQLWVSKQMAQTLRQLEFQISRWCSST